jgi:hypothetical protein
MPYQLLVDGVLRDLGDKRYLLSPQDLAAVNEIPTLIERGVCSFKIEGRLKSPEYVAAVTSVYRKTIDAAMNGCFEKAAPEDWYRLEMTFSRGLYQGWMHGVNHQELVGARFGKKRGAFVGLVSACTHNHVEWNPARFHSRREMALFLILAEILSTSRADGSSKFQATDFLLNTGRFTSPKFHADPAFGKQAIPHSTARCDRHFPAI